MRCRRGPARPKSALAEYRTTLLLGGRDSAAPTQARCTQQSETAAEQAAYQRQPERTHPLVWRHRSGRKSLVLGMTASHVEGMSLAQGQALLQRLMEWATQPQFVYRHEWRVGDLVVWDNTGTMHRVVPYALDSGRTMHRTTLIGEELLA